MNLRMARYPPQITLRTRLCSVLLPVCSALAQILRSCCVRVALPELLQIGSNASRIYT